MSEELQYDWVADEYRPRPSKGGRVLSTKEAQDKHEAQQRLRERNERMAQLRAKFSAPVARRRRNQALQQVMEGQEEWQNAARAAFWVFRSHGFESFICEDFRRWWMAREDYHEPRHHNAWGAFTSALQRHGLIRRTGDVRAASSTKSHARKMLEWEIVA